MLNKEISGLVKKSIIDEVRGFVPTDKIPHYIISMIYIHKLSSESTNLDKDEERIYNFANNLIKIGSKESQKRLINFIDNCSEEELKSYVEYLLLDYKDWKWNIFSNNELLEIVYELLMLKDSGDMIYDMGSGFGSFLAFCLKKARELQIAYMGLYGIEISSELAFVSEMAFRIINDSYNNARVINANALEDNNLPATAGYVFPPFGYKVFDYDKVPSKIFEDIVLSNKNSNEWIFVDKLLNKLNGGKAVAIVRGSALFSEADRKYRNRLIEKGYIEGIIELPVNSIDDLAMKIFIVKFSSNNKAVKFVDASEMTTNNPKAKKPILDYKAIIDAYNNKPSYRDLEELKDTLNLTPSNVLLDVTKPSNGVLLKELAEVFTGNQYTLGVFEKNGMLTSKNTGYRILTSGDIEDGVVNWAKLQRIEYNDTKFDKYAVKKNDIIVTSKSSKVKTVVVDIEPKDKIIVTGGMIIVRPDVTKLNPTYFKMFIDSQNGQNVLKSIQKGAYIVTINASALENIFVPIIPIEKQINKSNKYNEKLTTLLALKQEIEKVGESIKNIYFDESEDD